MHHIVTTGVPCSSRFRRLDEAKLAIAKADFLTMEAAGICRRSSSPWASPLHMVPKKDGSWRPCGDYRLLNLLTVPDKYPLPLMDDCRAKMAGCKIFSKLCLGFEKSLLAICSQSFGHSENCCNNPFWVVRVFENAFWVNECRGNVSKKS